MSNIPIMERVIWFDHRVREKTFPNAAILARQFEVSSKTAQRAVDFLRDRLMAPLEYDPGRKGYTYSDNSYELPHQVATEDEILALLLAGKLLSSSAGGFITTAIEKFGKRLFFDTGKFGLTESIIREGFSASWHGHSPAYSRTFRTMAAALLKRRRVHFTYQSPKTGETTTRAVEPHHLQYYMANWMLLAWCEKRSDWRKFHLARISKLRTLKDTFTPRPEKKWCHLLKKSFGIFQGKNRTWVRLRFTPFRARWIRDQVWHPNQKIEQEPGGALVLGFPVADFREIKMEILRYGADVEVLEPEPLKKEISDEIKKMAEIYKKSIDPDNMENSKKIST